MTNVMATGSGGVTSYGVYNNVSVPAMTNVTAVASGGTASNYGMFNTATSGSYTIVIDRSTFFGSSYGISSNQYYTVMLGASKLAGQISFGTGTFICAGSYTGSYAVLDSGCLPL